MIRKKFLFRDCSTNGIVKYNSHLSRDGPVHNNGKQEPTLFTWRPVDYGNGQSFAISWEGILLMKVMLF